MPVKTVPPKGAAASVEKNMAELLKLRLLVGIPDAAGDHDGTHVRNATLGYINEFGDDQLGIPPRPFLVPGVESVKNKMAAAMAYAGAAVLAGAPVSEARAGMEAAGLVAVNAVRQKLQDGPFVPLKPSTIRARAAKRDKDTGRLSQAGPSKDARKYLKLIKEGVPTAVLDDSGVGLAKPLVVTGQLRNSITYVVTTKGKG